MEDRKPEAAVTGLVVRFAPAAVGDAGAHRPGTPYDNLFRPVATVAFIAGFMAVIVPDHILTCKSNPPERKRRLRLYPATARSHGGKTLGTTRQNRRSGIHRGQEDLPRQDALHPVPHHRPRARHLHTIRGGVAKQSHTRNNRNEMD